MRARVAIRSQWKDLLIDTFPSLTLGKLFTEDGRREISSLTTIFAPEGLPGHSVLWMQWETKPWIRLAVAANWFDSDSSICKLIQTGLLGMVQQLDPTDGSLLRYHLTNEPWKYYFFGYWSTIYNIRVDLICSPGSSCLTDVLKCLKLIFQNTLFSNFHHFNQPSPSWWPPL